jgi:hypothetical protein
VNVERVVNCLLLFDYKYRTDALPSDQTLGHKNPSRKRRFDIAVYQKKITNVCYCKVHSCILLVHSCFRLEKRIYSLVPVATHQYHGPRMSKRRASQNASPNTAPFLLFPMPHYRLVPRSRPRVPKKTQDHSLRKLYYKTTHNRRKRVSRNPTTTKLNITQCWKPRLSSTVVVQSEVIIVSDGA